MGGCCCVLFVLCCFFDNADDRLVVVRPAVVVVVVVFERPGGMEKPGDDFEDTHNVRVQSKDTLFGGLVSRLQVRG